MIPRGVVSLFRMRPDKSSNRLLVVGCAFLLAFGVISGRLVQLARASGEIEPASPRSLAAASSGFRPDIMDRNGELMATSISSFSVFAEPRNIIDKDEATELLTAVLPDLNASELRAKLNTKKGFVWVKRFVTPREKAEVFRLGIPGVAFWPEHKRVYPNGIEAAHVLGATNLDGVGIAGIEKYIDNQGVSALQSFGLGQTAEDLKPLALSIDLRVQHALREKLAWGLDRFKAKAAAGMVYDVTTGEVVGLVSLPDFDPNNPADALDPDHINRMTVGVYEMGSTFKALTIAMALDSGKASINSSFSTAGGVMRFGRQVIREYHGTGRSLTVPEVFVHSSNMGSMKMALSVGVEGHKAFLRKLGQLDRMRTELPENAAPIVPQRWGEINTATIAFGHGLAVAPLQAVAAVGALMNGGKLITPTFLKRTQEQAMASAPQVIKPETSEAMRFIMRLNATAGSARKAAVPGFFVGGKTGTAEKVINGRYAKNRNFTTFMAVAPSDKPRYLFLTIMDEPKGIPETFGRAEAAWNSGDITGKVIEAVGPILLQPRFDPPSNPFPLMARLRAWGSDRPQQP
ncbi:penicillin-binding protein 2 [Terrarubrum flagellatum]|uniref:peptidoglycan D,D-transpeptidase FtsI family protein n=1 Tax=Terrirubrum flagellatum TaxID=2895980 RepID=UPI0031453A09